MSGRSKGCLLVLIAGVMLVAAPVVWRQVVVRSYEGRIFQEREAPPRGTAIIFGAAVFGEDRLSTVLRDRMDTAIALYHQGQVRDLLVSGDGVTARYDEPSAMKRYAVRRGVAEQDVRVDLGGRRTYDTCYRARDLFGVDEAVLVTQAFHLPRALFICDRLGIEAVGVAADKRIYRGARWYELRETAATLVALNDVIRQREPAITTLAPVLP